MNEQQTKLAQKDQEIAQLQSQIQNFDTEKELAKKEVEQTSHQALLAKDKEVQALENQLATLRLEHENQLQKTLSDLEKNAIRSKISSYCKKRKMSCLWLLLSKTTKPSSKQPVNKSSFIRILRLNNLQKRLGKPRTVCRE